jgi:hypothetical protein
MKGEVGFTAGADDYIIVYPINALVALEEKLGVSTGQIGSLLGEGFSMGNLRTMFWAGLLARHQMSETEAGDLISEIGIEKSASLVADALAKAFPGAGRSKGRPQKAGSGTGAAS